MKTLTTTILILAASLTITAQTAPKKATKIIVHSTEATKVDALNNLADFLFEHDIYFMDINEKRGMMKSEQFTSTGIGNWTTESTIIIVAKETPAGIELHITGSTNNNIADVTMVNKHFMGHVGGVMFNQVNDIVKQYDNKELISFSK